jgi:hypothetical protein
MVIALCAGGDNFDRAFLEVRQEGTSRKLLCEMKCEVYNPLR